MSTARASAKDDRPVLLCFDGSANAADALGLDEIARELAAERADRGVALATETTPMGSAEKSRGTDRVPGWPVVTRV